MSAGHSSRAEVGSLLECLEFLRLELEHRPQKNHNPQQQRVRPQRGRGEEGPSRLSHSLVRTNL